MRALLIAGAAVTVLGAALLARTIAAYLGSPLAASSTSGVRVFRLPDGTLGGFEPLTLGAEPTIIGVGLLLVVVALTIGAVFQRPSSRNLASTAGSNADAHTR